MQICLEPVAYFSCIANEKADLPRQGSLASGNTGEIQFVPGKNFEQALEDLEGMERIWIVFWMNLTTHWKPKIQPPRDVSKKSIFATRSPNRPNPIGLSCVTLLSVKGLNLLVQNHDLLDKTPVLDVKPYLEYADCFPGSKMGWMDGISDIPQNTVFWDDFALKQLAFLKDKGKSDLQCKIEIRLRSFSSPSSSNRIKRIGGIYYEASYKQWRILFQKEAATILVLAIFSGMDPSEVVLEEHRIHRLFSEEFEYCLSEKIVQNAFSLYSLFKQSKRKM